MTGILSRDASRRASEGPTVTRPGSRGVRTFLTLEGERIRQ